MCYYRLNCSRVSWILILDFTKYREVERHWICPVFLGNTWECQRNYIFLSSLVTGFPPSALSLLSPSPSLLRGRIVWSHFCPGQPTCELVRHVAWLFCYWLCPPLPAPRSCTRLLGRGDREVWASLYIPFPKSLQHHQYKAMCVSGELIWYIVQVGHLRVKQGLLVITPGHQTWRGSPRQVEMHGHFSIGDVYWSLWTTERNTEQAATSRWLSLTHRLLESPSGSLPSEILSGASKPLPAVCGSGLGRGSGWCEGSSFLQWLAG